jgi:alanine-alpha-ketoisovalerate/valine-pyruvate aminotransferase
VRLSARQVRRMWARGVVMIVDHHFVVNLESTIPRVSVDVRVSERQVHRMWARGVVLLVDSLARGVVLVRYFSCVKLRYKLKY